MGTIRREPEPPRLLPVLSDSARPPPSPDDAHSDAHPDAHPDAYADTVPAGLPASDPLPSARPVTPEPARHRAAVEREVLDLPAAAAARARQADRVQPPRASPVPQPPAPAPRADTDGFADSSFADSHFVESQFLDAAELNHGGDDSGSSRRCPMCGTRVKRILRTANDKRRWDADDWRRYRCRGEDCDWQGLMQASGRGRKRRSTPAQPTVTTARPRWALTLLAMLLAAALSWGAMQTLALMTGL